jgi:hypothetical protein
MDLAGPVRLGFCDRDKLFNQALGENRIRYTCQWTQTNDRPSAFRILPEE